MRTKHLVAALSCAALLLGASGCGGDSPKPPPLTSTPGTPSPTPTPTPTSDGLPDFTKWQDEPADIPVPQLPAAAKAHTKAGAVAFGKHYVALTNYALLTGSRHELDQLALPQCEICRNNGCGESGAALTVCQSYLGDPRYTVDRARQEDLSPTDAGATIFVSSSAFKLKTKDRVTTVDKQNLALVFRLAWTNGQWKVSDYTVGDI